ncbi:uncharacterized protein EV422DRAFT_498021 [Fimicolochytrium jonesii]|uniref:uncharacterized protein n=1 Tax=Fimicolochytrium jonesii TaxID=1396493 RepID=UPI0022FF33CC|nr:uncharacterized protein EV422DRAFT_498021 [Fimicolochytrium jonesii]KAI8819445.1 hypothetical protein EV422DRAFT_498021 [Fimicolochytrium jonesii]
MLLRNASVSRSSSFSQSGYFPHPAHAPSFARLPIPWSSTGAPRDSREADMLLGLALALSSYGAPLYRVEHRIAKAAEDLSLPVSVFCLPSTIMVAIGDGSARHPCRVQYLSYSYGVNVGKLHQVDRLARRVSALRKALKTDEKRRASAATTTPSVQQSRRILESPDSTNSVPSSPPPVPQDTTTTQQQQEKHNDGTIDDCLTDLQTITSDTDYSWPVRHFAGAMQSGVIAVLLFRGTWADGLAAFFLGGVTSLCLRLSNFLGLEGAVELLTSIAIACLARFMEIFAFWDGLSGTGLGLCHEVVSLAGVCALLPGTAITLGMLELGSTNPVAGSVRMFQAFVRALKLGYGLTLGSRLAIHLMQLFTDYDGSNPDACPVAGAPMDVWRLPLWIPMNLSIMINLRAFPWQWWHMSLTSLTGFCVNLLASMWFNSDITAGIAAFSIGLLGNLYARQTDDVAIGAILAGIAWLVPGGIGVRGAIAAIAKDATSSGTAFGIDMITRAMSIAVGI